MLDLRLSKISLIYSDTIHDTKNNRYDTLPTKSRLVREWRNVVQKILIVRIKRVEITNNKEWFLKNVSKVDLDWQR